VDEAALPSSRTFLQIATGSASELEYQLLLSRDLGFLPDENHRALADSVIEVKRMLTGFIKKLKADG
jgi:four helix bundle protein